MLTDSRENSINNGLSYVGNLNSVMLQSKDLIEGIKAQSEKRALGFSQNECKVLMQKKK